MNYPITNINNGVPYRHEMSDQEAPQSLITLDFATLFPHKYWVSDWSKDESYPEGFRYKILSVRDEAAAALEMAIVLEQPGGNKKVLKSLEGDLQVMEHTAKVFVERLAEEYGIEFDEFDFSFVRTFEDFERRAKEAGWC